jgi:FkbM family methyltransferase
VSKPHRSWLVLPLILLVLLAGCREAERPGILETGTKLYSQFDEELIIRDFFADRRDGFFLDVGAWHATRSSTTYYLEKHLGWSGIAIDAQKGLAPEWRRYRLRSRFFSYIVTDHSGGMETLYLGGPVSSIEPTHQEKLVESGMMPKREAEKQRTVQVETITLDDLLDREGVEEIDFLSMDIEQSEPQALAGFDIKRFKPELVCIEAHRNTRERISAYFERNGYERLEKYIGRDPANWYFAPAEIHETL